MFNNKNNTGITNLKKILRFVWYTVQYLQTDL